MAASSLAASIGGLRGFLAWWTAGLVDLIPASLRRALQSQPRRVAVEIDGYQARVGMLPPQGSRLSVAYGFALSGPETQERSAARAWLARRRAAPIVLRLPRVTCLSKTVSLPLAAEENLRQVLAFEMDRHTPYRAADVYFGFQVLERVQATQRLHVLLSVVPRELVDEALRRGAALGMRPAVVELADQDGSADALRAISMAAGDETRRAAAGYLNVMLGAFTLGLLVAALVIPLTQKRGTLLRLQETTATAKVRAAETAKIRDRLEETTGALDRMIMTRESTPLAVEVLNTLTRLLPDDTWLQSLELKGDKLVIQGQARTATRLIELLAASGRFENPTFQAPVQVNPQTGTERFNIAVQIRPDAAS
ncbi:MAG: PilN domain-containing protein [Chromatiales bacterium]